MRSPAYPAPRLAAVALAVVLAAPAGRAQTTVAFDFTGPALDPRLTAPEARAGVGYTVGDGRLQLFEAEGVGATAPYMFRPTFALAGDFTAEVQVSRSGMGRGEIGLYLTDVAGGALGSLTADRAALIGNAFVPTFQVGSGGSRSLIPATLTLQRDGARLRMYYDDGPSRGLILEATDVALTTPVVLSLVLQNRSGDTSAQYGALSGFTVTGTLAPLATTVPEPATWALLGTGLLGVGTWVRRGRRRAGRVPQAGQCGTWHMRAGQLDASR